MADFVGDRSCTTHYACDCIKARVWEVEEVVAEMRSYTSRCFHPSTAKLNGWASRLSAPDVGEGEPDG